MPIITTTDYNASVEGFGGQLPDGAVATTWNDQEPLVTGEKVVALHLFGIPLVSAVINPFTGTYDVMTQEQIETHIQNAIALVELEVGIEIMPRQHVERHPYDQKAQEAFGYTVLRARPIQSIEKVSIASTAGNDVWSVPTNWIDTGYLHKGQISIMPFAIAGQSGTALPTNGPIGLGLLPSIFRFHWVAGTWNITYTTGFNNGCVPRVLNNLIGTVTAMEILAALAATYARSQSSSLSIDGMSQSMSAPGPQLFETRIAGLAEKRKSLVNKVKRVFGLGLWSDNV